MNRIIPRRLLASSSLTPLFEATSSRTSSLRCLQKPFSQSCQRRAEGDGANSGSASGDGMSILSSLFGKSSSDRATRSRTYPGIDPLSVGYGDSLTADIHEDPHHFHVFATRHNTHITLTRPNRDPIISVSCGNVGFRKGQRKHYDSAFQLAAFTMSKMQDQGINAQIKKLEVVLRGFGAGREAVTKALLGTEGRLLRNKIVRVTDATRVKFGGTRSPKPRRLG